MKNNRKVFIMSWYYLFVSIILTLAPIVLLVFAVLDDNATLILEAKIFLYIFCLLAFIFFFCIFGFTFIQWVIIDKEKVVARNLFKIIRVSEWKDIVEVKEVKVGYTQLDPKFKWLVFLDKNDGDDCLRSPFNWKGKYIKLKANKRARSIVSEYQNLEAN